jgi:hypothetical protein
MAYTDTTTYLAVELSPLDNRPGVLVLILALAYTYTVLAAQATRPVASNVNFHLFTTAAKAYLWKQSGF